MVTLATRAIEIYTHSPVLVSEKHTASPQASPATGLEPMAGRRHSTNVIGDEVASNDEVGDSTDEELEQRQN